MERRISTRLGVAALVALVATALGPGQADAQLRAYYRVTSLNSGCWVDDQDPWPAGDPERYWRMGVFDSSTSTIFNACSSGCVDDGNGSTWDGRTSDYCSWSTGCGSWNFTDRTISKVIPNSRGAYFYFGLFDEDDNADDSLGDHWFWASSPSGGTVNNNNASPYYADSPISSVCGRDVTGIGDANNFSLSYSVWFEDASYPVAPATPNQSDDGLNNSGWDNDSRLDFNWDAASDPESGISGYVVSLWDSTEGRYIFLNQSVGTARSRSVCSSGCNLSYNPVHNHSYLFRIGATNGSYPTIDNQRTRYTGWRSFSVDRSSPSTSISADSSWHDTTFTVDINNSDSGSGFGGGTCEWRVVSGGSQTRAWAAHTCNGNVTPSVGSSQNCRHQGAGACRVEARATDTARLSSGTASRTFNIDWSADSIASITARTSPSGATIPESGWTQDRDPWFSWTIGTTIAPISSYHWRVDADPGSNCGTGTTTAGGNSGSAQLSAGALDEGVHTFYVRPRDAAGNCGNVETRVVRVDVTRDNMSNLRAENAAGQTIFEGVYQRETSPRMRWNPSSSTAPIVGYSYSTTGAPDCTADPVDGNSVVIGPLAQGATTFRIRPLDAAGNCGNVDSFDLAVDSVPDPITNLRAFTEAGGEPIQPDTPQGDNDPLMTWDPVATSVSAIRGYSFVFAAGDEQPDCTVGVVGNSVGAPSLPDGITTFRVQAIDDAGNCGPVGEFPINVDTQGVEILSLAAFTNSTRTVSIGNRVWQRDIDPYLEWDPEEPGPDAAAIVGYRFSLDASLPCVPAELHITDPSSTHWELEGLAQGVTRFRVMAVDAADNCGPVASFDIAVDTLPDPVIGLTATSSLDGSTIASGAWQQDTSPVMGWQDNPADPTTAPIVGYAWSTGGAPDCDAYSDVFSVPLAGLLDGQTTFRVLARDAAGNCGSPSAYVLAVDTTGDDPIGLRAVTHEGSSIEILDGDWQRDATPWVTWGTPLSPTSPIAGYNWSTDGAPLACEVRVASPGVALELSDGQTTFQVAAVDEAGNCGDTLSMVLAVDTVGEPLTGLQAFTDDTETVGILPDTWQRDATPFIAWEAPTGSTSPIIGYDTTLDGSLTCAVDRPTAGTAAALEQGATRISVMAVDDAGNCGPPAHIDLLLDSEGDAVTGLLALTESGGAGVPARTWVSDDTLYLDWADSASTAPIAGYSWTTEPVSPDCELDGVASAAELPVLPDGSTTVRVRAIDEAGNCGDSSSLELWIDTQPDRVATVSAETVPGGDSIGSGVWQQDAAPLLRWTVEPGGDAGIAGYNWTTSGDLDCAVVDTSASEVRLTGLPDGITTFEVVAIDDAGNCRADLAASFDVAVDTTPDDIVDLTALTGEGGDLVAYDTWQGLTDQPLFVWGPDADTDAPIAGYSWRALATGSDPGDGLDCLVDTTDTQVSAGALAQGRTTFEVRAVDAAGNCGLAADWIVAVDTEGDLVNALRAESTPGGEAIASGVWQTDATPRLLWDASDSTAPDAGYAWSTNGAPGCTVETTDRALDLSLDEGLTTAQVRVIDSAGNCSDELATFDLAVDTFDDRVNDLRALTEAGGSPIGDGVVQQDADPLLVWSPGPATAPIVGYSYAVERPDGVVNPGGPPDDPVPDCAADTAATELELGPLPEGTTTFRVRQLDAAGNCGVVERFDVVVDTQADVVVGLRALDSESLPVGHLTWQTDTDLTVLWDPSFAPATGAGYSYVLGATDAELDCTVDTTATEVSFVGLDDGIHTFRIRAIDAASNCGDIALFALAVDTAGDDLLELEAVHVDSGEPLGDGVWQTDTAPLMRWSIADPGPDAAPIAGYAWRLGGTPPCAAETTETEVDLVGLDDAAVEFAVVARDLAGNCGLVSRFTLAVDTLADDLDELDVFASEGGPRLTSGEWQRDTDPFVTWTAPASVSPIVGYSVGVDEDPSCAVDVVSPGLTFPPGGLEQGRTTLAVAAVDAAGNCGLPATFEVAADSQPDAITKLDAFTELPDGEPVGDGEWQRDPNLAVAWEAAPSTSPIVGYAFTTSPDALDCGETTFVTDALLPALPEGITTFRLRALDEAGNCGPVASYRLAVDTQPDAVANLQALTAADGSQIFRGEWQRDADPLFTWEAPSAPTSPIVGFSWSIDDPALPLDATVETLSTEAAPVLPDGETWFRVRAVDAAGNPGTIATFLIKVDQTPDDVAALRVLSELGGEVYEEGVWVADETVLLDWGAPESAAPLTGYSWGLGTGHNCTLDIDDPDTTLASPPMLDDGVTTFWVRAVDEAGNCGEPAAFELSVDTTGDAVTDLTVLTEAVDGELIAHGAWQQDNDPYLTWSVPASDAPIAGFAVGLDTEPSCGDALGPATSFAFDDDAIADGQHRLWVVTRDDAGNCATTPPFDLWVLAAAPELVLEPITPNPARAGRDLAIRVSADRELASPPTVRIGELGEADSTGSTGGVDTYAFRVDGGLPEGPHEVLATGTDLAGNSGTAIGEVVFDFTPPGLLDGLRIEPSVATAADPLLVELEADEVLAAAPEVVIAADNAASLGEVTGNAYLYDYTVTGAEGEGPVEVAVRLADRAGNTTDLLTTFALDLTPPVVDVTSPDRRWVLDMGDELEIVWATADLHPSTVDIWLSTDAGATYATPIAEGVDDTGSYTWTVAGEQTNAARFRVVATDLVGLTGQDESPIDVRLREPVPDHVVAVAGGGPTLVGTSAEVVLMVVDELGDPVDGVFEVRAQVDGSAVIAATSLEGAVAGDTHVTGMTAADGTATLEVFDLVAETVRVEPTSPGLPANFDHVGANVIFEAQAADHLVVHVDDGVANVGETESLMVVTVDRAGNPADADVDVRVSVDGNAVIASSNLRSAIGIGSNEIFGRLRSDGTASVQVQSGVTETVLVSAHSGSLPNDQPDEPAQVVFAQLSDVDPLRVTIEADPPRVYADDVAFSTVTVTPRNAAGDIIGSGLDVDVQTDVGRLEAVDDEGDGTYTTRIRSADCYDDPVPIGARVEDVIVDDGATVTFTCDEIGGGTLDAEPDGIVADGETCAIVTLALEDPGGEPMPEGQYVAFSATYGAISPARELGGFYRATLCSDVCADDPIVLTATVNGVALTDVDAGLRLEVPVECLGVDPARSTVAADPRSALADGQSASTITVSPVRLDGQAMGAGLEVDIRTTLGDLTSVFDAGDGTYTAQLTSETIGEAVVTARVAGTLLDDDERVTFLDFTPPADWVTVAPQLLGLDPAESRSVLVAVNLRNESPRELDGLTVRMTAPDGLEVDATRTRFGDDPVIVSFDGSAREWAITLSSLPLPTDERAMASLDLVLRRSASAELGDDATLLFRAWWRNDPVSQVVELSLGGTLDEETIGKGACGCSASDASTSHAPWLLLLGLLSVSGWRRRRRA